MTFASEHKPSNSAALKIAQSALEQRFGPIDYRSPDSLTAYANNPRKHPERQIVQLMASISEFGFVMPALLDTNGVIIAGEARIEAAKRLTMKLVPTITAEQWSKAQVQAYRLADNRLAEQATWDLKLLQIEISEIIELA